MTDWTYDGRAVTDEDIEGHVAFVYLITRKDTGRKYIGKKRLTKKVTKKPLKGKKRKRVTITESDWRSYFGSNDELNKDVAELGPENFTREILVFCKTLGASSYVEIKYQLMTDCIVRDDFYNIWCSARITQSHLKGLDHEIISQGSHKLNRAMADTMSGM